MYMYRVLRRSRHLTLRRARGGAGLCGHDSLTGEFESGSQILSLVRYICPKKRKRR